MSKVVPMDEVKAWPLKTYPPHRDQAHALDLKDFAIQHAGLPIGEPLTIIEDHLRPARRWPLATSMTSTDARIPSCGFSGSLR